MSQNIILKQIEIEHIIKRIAFQIYETFVDEQSIVIAGISANGFVFAKKIAESLTSISAIQVELCEVFIDKINPALPVTTSIDKKEYQNKVDYFIETFRKSGSGVVNTRVDESYVTKLLSYFKSR